MADKKASPVDSRPKATVISIALREEEFAPLREALAQQTFQEFEFVGEVGGTIPEAWNRAIARAKGEILVFTETDAKLVNENWLEEMVNNVPDDRTIIKGLEITMNIWDLSNLACYRSVLDGVQFDPDYLWAEDTELFCRLEAQGYKLVQVDQAPVIHLQKMGKKRTFRRAFRYGMYWSRLRHRYGEPVDIRGIATTSKMLVGTFLNLFGLILGYVLYWPERRFRNRR